VSNYSQFFPTGPSGTPTFESRDPNFLFCRTPGNKTNRQIFYGPSNQTWSVPQGTTEVEVHVWGGGGGGNGTCTSGGGGGGGYARTRYKVTSSDTLCVTVGGAAGTSTVTIPTQAPTSPVSATGGSNASPTCTAPNPGGCCGYVGGAGGTGTVSLGPTHPRSYCFTASGGSGTSGYFTDSPPVGSLISIGGGGGAAGSPLGPGGPGGWTGPCFSDTTASGSGGGIGGCNFQSSFYDVDTSCPYYSVAAGGGGSMGNSYFSSLLTPPASRVFYGGGIGRDGNFYVRNCCGSTPSTPVDITYCRTKNENNEWFAVEQIQGAGGFGAHTTHGVIQPVDGGAGAGGGGAIRAVADTNPGTPTREISLNKGVGGNGGFLGGGSGLLYVCCGGIAEPLNTATSGGCAGGSGGGNPGTPGVVIIYW
jgi:hypothetical protein